jgi:hypothetical protein
LDDRKQNGLSRKASGFGTRRRFVSSYKGQPVIGFAPIAADLKSTALTASIAAIVVALFNIDGDVFAPALAANNLELFAQPSNFVVFGESGYFHLCNNHF